MSVETWGQLDKSQDDSEKVEAAISRLIAEHEADPDSHLGVGESLEAHRASEVIDHTAGSVVADKLQAGGLILITTFENLANFTVTGNVNKYYFPGVEMYADTGTPKRALIQNLGVNTRNVVDFSFDFLLQFSFMLSSEGSPTLKFSFGAFAGGAFTRGLALELTPASDKVHLDIVDGDYYTADLSISRANWHTFRIAYIALEAKIYIYLDGVIVATMDYPVATKYSIGSDWAIDLLDGATGESASIVEYLMVSRGN